VPRSTIVQVPRARCTTRPVVSGRSRDRDERRSDRAAARRVVWSVSELPRLKQCGHRPITPDGRVGVRMLGAAGERIAGFAGLASCGSVWSCPVCSAQIMVRRREDVALAVDKARERGWSVVMVTLTVRHRKGQPLASVWDAVSAGWGAVTSGSGWVGGKIRKDGSHKVGDKERYGITGYIRAAEVTHGEHGWHPHVHALLFLDGPISEDGAIALGMSMWQRWDRAVRKAGFSSLRDHGGLDAHVVNEDAQKVMADYFTKVVYQPDSRAGDIASELTLGGLTKDGRLKGRTPMQILRSIVETGDADDLDLWLEWERVSRGRRALTWSTGLREVLGLDAEATDEEIAAEEIGSVQDTVVVLTAQGWRTLRDGELETAFLGVIERHGPAVARPWLDSHRVEWLDPADL
jgi:hypothetical protein